VERIKLKTFYLIIVDLLIIFNDFEWVLLNDPFWPSNTCNSLTNMGLIDDWQ
jgi:hypothetical protein